MPKTKDGGFFLDDREVNKPRYTIPEEIKKGKKDGDGKQKDKKAENRK